MKRYCFDIDGTICRQSKLNGYATAFPYEDRINLINQLYDVTLNQLKDWGCKFHELHLGKPSADYYIDDKGISDKNFFEKL